ADVGRDRAPDAPAHRSRVRRDRMQGHRDGTRLTQGHEPFDHHPDVGRRHVTLETQSLSPKTGPRNCLVPLDQGAGRMPFLYAPRASFGALLRPIRSTVTTLWTDGRRPSPARRRRSEISDPVAPSGDFRVAFTLGWHFWPK